MKQFLRKKLYIQFLCLSIGSLVLSLAGGLWVTSVVTHIHAEQASIEELRLITKRDMLDHYNQQLWLQRVSESKNFLKKLQSRQLINPPHREWVRQYLLESTDTVNFLEIKFDPENIDHVEAAYNYCHQFIHAKFQCQNDRFFVEWLTKIGDSFPGLLTPVDVKLEKTTLASSPLLSGEVTFKWSFLRFTFLPASY